MGRDSSEWPEGLVLQPEFVSPPEAEALVELARGLRFGEVRMHGVASKRRVAQFGWRYAFESFRLTAGPEIPP